MTESVIIAGAGPVGLTAALVLAEAGISVTLLEKREGFNTASRASTFHPPTIEILHRLGVADALLKQGQAVDRIQYRTAAQGVFAEFQLSQIAGETQFPLRIHLEQARILPAMLEKLARYPHADIRFATELTDVALNDDGVAASVTGPEGGTVLTGAYLIGADGARSQARQSLGIGFDGEEYGHRVLRLMTRDDLTALLPGLAPITYLFNGANSASFLKMPDCWRIILRVAADVPDATALRDDWIIGRLREALPGWERMPETIHRDVYGASKRLAPRWLAGRAVLMGDAAHVTNTRGGMNMNAGVHDADHIARAIIAALGSGDHSQVEHAVRERQRVAAELLIPRTDRSVAGGPGWLEQVRAMAADPAEALAFLRQAAMLDMLDRSAARR